MYRYETHLHTSPVSKCAKFSVRENLEFYKELGYDGVFITNHFLDGNTSVSSELSYEDRIKNYCSDYEDGVKIGKELGIKVFFGVEMTYKGTDFLVYGLDKEWYIAHPEIMDMKKSEELPFLMASGALVIHAHPYREAKYIDHIRLFPRGIHGVETVNACRTDFENRMAAIYAEEYGFAVSAGADNHAGRNIKRLAGVETESPIDNERDFISRVLAGEVRLFTLDNPLIDA